MVLYTPKHFEQKDFGRTLRLIRDNPLSTIISGSSSYLSTQVSLEISHIPFTIRSYDESTREILLIGHMAKQNDQVAQLEKTGEATVVFRSSYDSYISAAWYESKKEHHKVVSTWDYAALHCDCEVRVIRDDPQWMLGMLEETTGNYEGMRNGDNLIEERWKVSDAPTEYINALMKGIVGLEVKVKAFKSKVKANQNKPAKDVSKILKGYEEEIGGPKAAAMRKMTAEEHPRADLL